MGREVQWKEGIEMTAYDYWKTSEPERDDEAWEDASNRVAWNLSESATEEMVSIIANADAAINWLCGAITVPDQYLHAFRDLVVLVSGTNSQVEKEMKAYHDARD